MDHDLHSLSKIAGFFLFILSKVKNENNGNNVFPIEFLIGGFLGFSKMSPMMAAIIYDIEFKLNSPQEEVTQRKKMEHGMEVDNNKESREGGKERRKMVGEAVETTNDKQKIIEKLLK